MTLSSFIPGLGQVNIETDQIESLIDEWNFAHNTRNMHSFANVYAANLLFYTERVTRRRAISLKEQLFELNPDFRQRIITEINYKPYSKGVVKCDFTKEVFERTSWKKYPSYLLVSYDNNSYAIVGESDYATDRVLKFKPDIGEPMTFEKKLPAEAETAADSTQVRAETNNPTVGREPPRQREDRPANSDPLVEAVLPDIAAMGAVTVPKGYIYILVGMLGLGGLMIVIADSFRRRRRPRRRPIAGDHSEAEQLVRNFKVQSDFESFVVTLFDPLFFKYRRPKREPVYAGKTTSAQMAPDFLFEYNQKEVSKSFAVKCQYYKNIARNEVQLFPGERQKLFRQFEEENELDLYYVLGFGGTPDDPKELFFIPAREIKDEYISKENLSRHSKSGMFYYNRRTGRIQ